jgi:hypothetical protein
MPFFSRTVHRRSLEPDQSSITVGFRCAADAETTNAAGGVDLNPQSPVETNTGVDNTAVEEPNAGSQPTLPPPPGAANTSAPVNTPQDSLATLPPGG